MSKIVFEKDFPRHPLHYFVLMCIQLVGLWGVFWFSYDAVSQLMIVAAMAVSYVGWGIVHHRTHRDLHPKIVVEYVLVSLAAVLIFSSLIFSS